MKTKKKSALEKLASIKKPSRLLTVALADLRRAEKMPNVRINMDLWL